MTVSIPSFIAEDGIIPAPGAMHFKIHAQAIDIAFGTGAFSTKMFESDGMKPGTDPARLIDVISGQPWQAACRF